MQNHRRWPIDWHAPELRKHGYPRAFLVPDFPIPKGLSPLWASLLPNIDYNDSMLASLPVRPAWASVADIATCYMADPFLNPEQFAKALIERGVHRVANLPCTGLFEAGYAALLNQVRLGFARELERLRVMAEHDLALYIAVSDDTQFRQAMALKPAALIAVCPPSGETSLPDFLRMCREAPSGADGVAILVFKTSAGKASQALSDGSVSFGAS